MDNDTKGLICAGIASISLIIGGLVGSKEEKKCDIYDGYHVHCYTYNINDNVCINRYVNSEKDSLWNLSTYYNKTDKYIPATTEDLKIYNLLSKKELFDGRDNIDYINYQIENNKDYLEFYYYYTTTRTVYHTKTHIDSEGHTHTESIPEVVTDVHSGWSEDSYHRGVTGKTRVVHKKYFAYKVINDDELSLEKSELVDDIREIINEYPYINVNCSENVYEVFRFKTRELPYLNIDDFNPFYTPTVENNPLNNIKTKKIYLN